jgi:beta-N-acetylhexosaminidase
VTILPNSMKFLFAFFKLLLGFALVVLALDWRSPLLTAVRPWALTGLIGFSLMLILAEGYSLWSSVPSQRARRAWSSLGLLMAIFALSVTLVLEARFQWTRHRVLHADQAKLETLGRHLIVGCRSFAEVRHLVVLRAVAGVFLSSHNVSGKSVARICGEVQSLQRLRIERGLPLLWIATDQEGGIVSRLTPPLTPMPPLSEVLGQCSDLDRSERAVRKYAQMQGRELAEIGVNLNFAPVVDVNHQVMNPHDRFTRIYRRAISPDPAVVTRVAGWYCSELEAAGVRCTLKHFPGLGRISEDTHLGHATLTASVAELMETDWLPFLALMRESSAFTMLGHVRLAAIDSERPASISPAVIAGLLRRDWNYNGLLVSDDFCMRSMYHSNSGIEDGAIEALNAGLDLILISWDPDQYYPVMHALLQADQQGLLNHEALRRSDERLRQVLPASESPCCR